MNGLFILFLSLWISYAACTVKVADSGGTPIVGTLHSNLNLECDVTGSDTFDAWKNPAGETVHNSAGFEYVTSGSKHKLKILSLEAADGGRWTCVSKQGNNDSVIVHVPISLVNAAAKQQFLVEGLGGIVEVNIRGYPLPKYTWKKDGTDVPLGTGRFSVASNGSLLISRVNLSDGGTYDVIGIQNALETPEKGIVVKIRAIPKFGSSSVIENRTVGQSIMFKCNATGIPDPTISWKKGSEELPVDTRRVITKAGLEIKNVDKSDVGEYTCVAKNVAGAVEQVSKLVYVFAPPNVMPIDNQVIEKGKDLRVYCNGTGDPAPDVEWTKNGNPLPSEQQIKTAGKSLLQLLNVQPGQSGTYECSAKNGAVNGTGDEIIRRLSMNLSIVYPPEFVSKFKSPMLTGLNEDVEFNCSATGNPAPGITLSFNGKALKGTLTNSTMKTTLLVFLNSTKPEDLGVYTCTASNTVNTIQQTVTLKIPLDKPKIFDVKFECKKVAFSWRPDIKKRVSIKSYIVSIKETVSGGSVKIAFVSGNLSDHAFSNLEEQTRYTLSVTQETGYKGIGHTSVKTFTTRKCPYKKINDVNIDENKVTVYWPAATRKVDLYILRYRIKGAEHWKNETTKEVFASVSGLSYGKQYEFRVYVQSDGNEEPYSDIKVVETKATPTPTPDGSSKSSSTTPTDETTRRPGKPVARKDGLSGGVIAAIVIVIILLVLIAVDIFCCFFNQCGVVHMCAAACSGKSRDKYAVDGTPEEGTKLKEIDESKEAAEA